MEAYTDQRLLELGPPQQRLVLAALAVDAGRVVSVQTLIDRVWDEAPAEPRRTLHVQISRLRRRLTQADGTRAAQSYLVHRHGGYVLDVDPEFVDLHRFRQLHEQARVTERTDTDRVVLLREAMRLWRGQPLLGLDGPWVTRTRQAWSQQHVDGVVAWARAELNLCNPGVVIAPVAELLAQFPLVEPLVAVLMRALYASGRIAEALAHYTRFRQQLVDELGVDPGTELQAVHRAILQGDPNPAPAAAPPPVSALAVAPPQQLPRCPAWFTGRTAELERLLALVPDPRQATAVVVCAIEGMAGIGKTALAVHAAQLMIDWFPDGQLYIDLHGFNQGATPVEAANVLERLLQTLGVPGKRIPAEVDDRAALWRSVVAGRRVLIVLDNAAAEAQVAPLLPGAAGCLVLVTSRRRLVGLEATHTVSLDTLPLADSVALLCATAGLPQLTDEARGLVEEAVGLCGRLPLAILIAGARLQGRPAWALAELAARLRNEDLRLAALADPDGTRSITAALELSYQQLSAAGPQRMYRLLGLHPGSEFDLYAAAALVGTDIGQARRLLDRLVDAHLLQQSGPNRYTFHDLVRAHATALADAEPDRQEALRRLLDYFRSTPAVMDISLIPMSGSVNRRSLPATSAVSQLDL